MNLNIFIGLLNIEEKMCNVSSISYLSICIKFSNFDGFFYLIDEKELQS